MIDIGKGGRMVTLRGEVRLQDFGRDTIKAQKALG